MWSVRWLVDCGLCWLRSYDLQVTHLSLTQLHYRLPSVPTQNTGWEVSSYINTYQILIVFDEFFCLLRVLEIFLFTKFSISERAWSTVRIKNIYCLWLLAVLNYTNMNEKGIISLSFNQDRSKYTNKKFHHKLTAHCR